MPFNNTGNINVPYYGGGQVAAPSNVIQKTTNPTTSFVAANVGDLYVNTTSNNIFSLVDKAGGVATWVPVAGQNPGTYIPSFNESPILQSNANTGAAPTGSTGDVNLMMLQGGEIMQQFIIGAGATIIAPRMDANGLLISMDLTATEGGEYNFGVLATNKHQYTIGTSPAFFIEAKVYAADISGLDPLLIGFRKNAANNGTYTSYTDFAAIGARATTSANKVVIATNLNSGGATYTNTTNTWTDATAVTFRVNVSSSGVVTYLINGSAPTTTAAFTFDSTDVVTPFIHYVFGATSPGAINLQSLKIGYQ